MCGVATRTRKAGKTSYIRKVFLSHALPWHNLRHNRRQSYLYKTIVPAPSVIGSAHQPAHQRRFHMMCSASQLASPRRPCAYRRAVKPAPSALRAACPLCAQIATSSDEARQRRACRASASHAQSCKIALVGGDEVRDLVPPSGTILLYHSVKRDSKRKKEHRKSPGERLPVGVLSWGLVVSSGIVCWRREAVALHALKARAEYISLHALPSSSSRGADRCAICPRRS